MQVSPVTVGLSRRTNKLTWIDYKLKLNFRSRVLMCMRMLPESFHRTTQQWRGRISNYTQTLSHKIESQK